MNLNWDDYQEPLQQMQPVQQPLQQPLQQPIPQLPQQPPIYHPSQFPQEEPQQQYELIRKEMDLKEYLTIFILIVIIYFILSLDEVKRQISKVLTCINPDIYGTVSMSGFICYGIVLAALVVASKYVIDKYLMN